MGTPTTGFFFLIVFTTSSSRSLCLIFFLWFVQSWMEDTCHSPNTPYYLVNTIPLCFRLVAPTISNFHHYLIILYSSPLPSIIHTFSQLFEKKKWIKKETITLLGCLIIKQKVAWSSWKVEKGEVPFQQAFLFFYTTQSLGFIILIH